MRRGYAEIPGGQLHYREEGQGEVILLLHSAGSSSDEFTRVIPYLSNKYRAIAVDLPGYGESDKPARKYRIEDHARTVFQVMDALRIKKANVVGNHTGGEIGTEMAVTQPGRVDRLMMYGIPFFANDEDFLAYTSKSVYDPVTIRPDGGHLLEWWRRSIRYGDPPEIANERTLDFLKAGERGGELHEAAFAYVSKLREKLPKIKCPTLLMGGTKDRHSVLQCEVKKLLTRSEMITIPDGPVLITRVMPKEFAEAILKFVENSEPGSSAT